MKKFSKSLLLNITSSVVTVILCNIIPALIGERGLSSVLHDKLIVPGKLVWSGILIIQKRFRNFGIEVDVADIELLSNLAVIGLDHVHSYPPLIWVAVDSPLRHDLVGLFQRPVRAGSAVYILHCAGPLFRLFLGKRFR